MCINEDSRLAMSKRGTRAQGRALAQPHWSELPADLLVHVARCGGSAPILLTIALCCTSWQKALFAMEEELFESFAFKRFPRLTAILRKFTDGGDKRPSFKQLYIQQHCAQRIANPADNPRSISHYLFSVELLYDGEVAGFGSMDFRQSCELEWVGGALPEWMHNATEYNIDNIIMRSHVAFNVFVTRQGASGPQTLLLWSGRANPEWEVMEGTGLEEMVYELNSDGDAMPVRPTTFMEDRFFAVLKPTLVLHTRYDEDVEEGTFEIESVEMQLSVAAKHESDPYRNDDRLDWRDMMTFLEFDAPWE